MRTLNTISLWKDRLLKPELDSGRVQRVYQNYDIGHGYAEYLEQCRSGFQRTLGESEPNPLLDRGFEFFSILDAPETGRWREDLLANHSSGLIKKDSRHLEGFHVEDPAWTEAFVASVLTGQVDRRIAEYFRSEYLIHWVTFSVTRKAEQQESVSFRWHCDKGPSTHLKLIFYLNPTSEHGGNTEFMDLEDTAAVARKGYIFGRSRSRSGDTDYLSRIAGKPLATHSSELNAGQAVLFQPARVLHRGISPARGDRLVMTLCLLPSPVNWRLAWKFGAQSDLAIDEKWHEDAMHLFEYIERRLAQFKELENP